MIYAYLRVSTDKQDYNNQKLGINKFCETKCWNIDKEIIDNGISGAKEPEERKLGKILKKIKYGDIIVCSELSRLGRKLFMIMRILEHCMKVGAKVYTVKENYKLGDDLVSKVLAFAFGISAEIERKLISERTKEALQRRKNNGYTLGKPKGSKNTHYKLDPYLEKIIKWRIKGVSKAKISRKCKCNITTLDRFLLRNKIN
jgi:DNA invertase Pin-like site-specific DNA recombinase